MRSGKMTSEITSATDCQSSPTSACQPFHPAPTLLPPSFPRVLPIPQNSVILG